MEFSSRQLARIDEVECAAYDFLKVLTDKGDDLPWNMELISDIADTAADILAKKGMRVYYPAIIQENGKEIKVSDYPFEEGRT